MKLVKGSRKFEEGIHLYHLRHSCKRAGVAGLTVRRPRHFIAYRITTEGGIEILRVLHDAMDLTAHLTDQNE